MPDAPSEITLHEVPATEVHAGALESLSALEQQAQRQTSLAATIAEERSRVIERARAIEQWLENNREFVERDQDPTGRLGEETRRRLDAEFGAGASVKQERAAEQSTAHEK